MRIDVDGLIVYFPFPNIYPEQYLYFKELKRTLDAGPGSHCIIEMPTGTGKTITLLAFITSYQLRRPEMAKLVYCTRTVGEMEKVLEELERLIIYRDKFYAEDFPEKAAAAPKLLALGLTTRRNLCLHPDVISKENREEADAACRSLTAPWVRSSVMEVEGVELVAGGSHGGASSAVAAAGQQEHALCEFYEGYKREGSESILPSGVYTLDALTEFGRRRKWCPYYTARHGLSHANVIVYNYQYLLDPKIAGLISRDIAREAIVVFDEAHNIDSVCIDALSVNIREATLRKSLANINRLRDGVVTMRNNDRDRLQQEYNRLVTGMSTSGLLPAGSNDVLANPIIPDDIVAETVPGNIRKADHFIQYLRRLVQYIRDKKMRGREAKQEQPARFLHDMLTHVQGDVKTLRFCSDRLKSLLHTLEISDGATFTPLQMVADFVTLLGTYGHTKSFAIVFEPVDDRLPNVPNPVLQLACLDASLAMRPVFSRFHTVVLTSGTISPMNLYAKILGFVPVVAKSLSMSLQRRAICPIIVSRGPDQVAISSKFDCRSDTAVTRNYGSLLIELAGTVPDGIVVFFPSYVYMDHIITLWLEMGIINRIVERKLVFIETPDAVESALALDRYRCACDSGRGAMFFCVARGKVAEGIDFDRHYGRCVAVLGVPFQYTESRVLRARLEYMRSTLNIREGDYLSFDAMRQTAQCIGRVVRSKTDYGIAVLADKRFVRADKKNKLPQWILDLMLESHIDLDTQAAIGACSLYLKQMAQTVPDGADRGTALLTEEDVGLLSKTDREKSIGNGTRPMPAIVDAMVG
jgi:DNA excision repair protein ERCC-2